MFISVQVDQLYIRDIVVGLLLANQTFASCYSLLHVYVVTVVGIQILCKSVWQIVLLSARPFQMYTLGSKQSIHTRALVVLLFCIVWLQVQFSTRVVFCQIPSDES